MKLLFRNLSYHRRVNIATALAVSVCVAIITGALIIGDTVRHSLAETARQRLGFVDSVAVSESRSFSPEIPNRISGSRTAAVNLTTAAAINPESMVRANNIQMLGIDNSLATASGIDKFKDLGRNEAVINSQLASLLNAKPGSDLILRFANDNMIAELALYSGQDYNLMWRVTVKDIVSAEEFGNFSLKADQKLPANIFVPASQLAQKLESADTRNMLLIGDKKSTESLQQALTLSDLGYNINTDEYHTFIKSDNIFINKAVQAELLADNPELRPFTGYMVNDIVNQANNKSAAYCFTGTDTTGAIDDNSAIVSQWLADTISAKTGDRINIKFFLPAENNELKEDSITLTIKAIVPIDSLTPTEKLMPEIPGMTETDSCTEWESGVPIDTNKITDADEKYWDDYRMTPKLIISYSLAEKLFASRYGLATALFSDQPLNDTTQIKITDSLKQHAQPEIITLADQANFAVNNSLDFGGLFLSLSMFLIASALLLPAMLFAINIQNRNIEIASLKSIGYTHKKIKKLIFSESAIIAMLGGLPGIILGIAYAHLLNLGLADNFSGAIAGFKLSLFIKPETLLTGYLATAIVVIIAIYLKTKGLLKRTIRQAFNANIENVNTIKSKAYISKYLAIALLITAAAVPIIMNKDVMSFFTSGAILLVSGLLFFRYAISSICVISKKSTVTQLTIILNNLRRNISSSLTVAISIACGVFMVIAVGLNHHNPLKDADKPYGPTGGFDLAINCSVPISHLIKPAENQTFSALQFRVNSGDDASCLNLNRPGRPSVIAADLNKLIQYKPFSFASTIPDAPGDWSILKDDNPNDKIIPAVTDYNTIMWALHKKVGDLLEIKAQDGNSYQFRLVAGLQSSILQGKLIIDETAFKRLFPKVNGYDLILVKSDKPAKTLLESLSGQLEEYGPEIRPATDIIAELYRVENTYMSLFALLGGLGMVMGCIVLALTVVRNTQSQRREYAILQALGFTPEQIRSFIFVTWQIPATSGTFIAVITAAYAVWPKLITRLNSTSGKIDIIIYGGLTLFVFLAVTFACISLAARFAASSNITQTLRNK